MADADYIINPWVLPVSARDSVRHAE